MPYHFDIDTPRQRVYHCTNGSTFKKSLLNNWYNVVLYFCQEGGNCVIKKHINDISCDNSKMFRKIICYVLFTDIKYK
ncbi:hypothetical protein PIROE2DRAFT_11838 [Piromyces sp. E2]|nr:hypothetical protein PIROE2DRAFT_11838 [Piromyces sp. E2]|eukprot:OUM62015.1 hypothetical protein PIROE2DRAFT_11838 [Piromyces sp. E2]